MKKINLLLSGAILCAAFISQTEAQTGAYIGIDGGIGGMASNLNNSGIAIPVNQESKIRADGGTFDVHAGFTFANIDRLSLGVEGGYQGYANNTLTRTRLDYENEYETLTYSGNYTDIMGVAQLQLTPKWGVILKSGTAHVSQTTSFGGTIPVGNDNQLAGHNESNLPVVELGSTYKLSKNHQLNILATAVISPDEPSTFPSQAATREGINRIASIAMIKASYEISL